MSITLRILLLAGALFTTIWILHKIRKLKVKMEHAIFWVIFAGILCILGVFPEITYRLTEVMGIMSPANLIFLIIIFLLIEKIFTLSVVVSQLEEKVSILSAEIALRSQSTERKIENIQREHTVCEEEIAHEKV